MDRDDSLGNRRRNARANGEGDAETSLPLAIGARVRGLRTRQRYSLERLAQRASVSRAMLSQIENGQSVPTILLLMKVAAALDVPLASLVAPPKPRQTVVLVRQKATVLSSAEGSFTLRPLLPEQNAQSIGFFEGSIAGAHSEAFEPRGDGIRESLVIARGRVELTVGDAGAILLHEGDAAFVAETDTQRSLRNPDAERALFYLVRGQGGTL
jgi:transcriptional regulator with XRE-family HTH domain